VWARGLSTVTGRRLFLHGEFATPVQPHEVKAAAERAILMQQAEKVSLARIAKGERVPDVNGTRGLRRSWRRRRRDYTPRRLASHARLTFQNIGPVASSLPARLLR
jgi:hypothetical protein